MAGRKPDYNVSAFIKPEDGGDLVEKGNVGVAWKSDKDDGRISVRLHGFVTLTARPGLYITLFPMDDDRPRDDGKAGRRTTGRRGGQKQEDMDDDIPF